MTDAHQGPTAAEELAALVADVHAHLEALRATAAVHVSVGPVPGLPAPAPEDREPPRAAGGFAPPRPAAPLGAAPSRPSPGTGGVANPEARGPTVSAPGAPIARAQGPDLGARRPDRKSVV